MKLSACILIVVCCTRVRANTAGCESERMVSDDRALLPLEAITASDAMSDDPARDVVDRDTGFGDVRDSWCSAQQFQAGPMPYIMFNFAERVSLTRMIGRGERGGNSYVTSFPLDILDEVSGEFVQYTRTGDITEFTTDSFQDVQYTFSPPAVGRVFRFRILDGVRHHWNDDFCWNVILFGCLAPPTPQPSTTSPDPAIGTSMIPPVSIQASPTVSSLASPTVSSLAAATTTVVSSAGTTGPGTPPSSVGSSLAVVVAPSVIGGAVVVLIMVIVLLLLALLIARRRSVERFQEQVVREQAPAEATNAMGTQHIETEQNKAYDSITNSNRILYIQTEGNAAYGTNNPTEQHEYEYVTVN